MLRSDVPAFADRELSWDIYADNVQLADPVESRRGITKLQAVLRRHSHVPEGHDR